MFLDQLDDKLHEVDIGDAVEQRVEDEVQKVKVYCEGGGVPDGMERLARHFVFFFWLKVDGYEEGGSEWQPRDHKEGWYGVGC